MKSSVWLLVFACFFISAFGALAADKPEFTIQIGTLMIDGVKDADIEVHCL